MQLNRKKYQLENNDIKNQDFINQMSKNKLFSGFVVGYNNGENTGKIISALNNYNSSANINIIDTKDQFNLNIRKKNFQVSSRLNPQVTNSTFSQMITNAMRSAPDVVICGLGKRITDLESVTTLMLTGHTVVAMWDQPSVYETVSQYLILNNNMHDFISCLSYIYAGKSCIADDDLNFIEINEYILIDKTTRDDLYECPQEYLPQEFKNIMKRNKWTFEDDLRKKYKEGLITEKYYNLYLEELDSTS